MGGFPAWLLHIAGIIDWKSILLGYESSNGTFIFLLQVCINHLGCGATRV